MTTPTPENPMILIKNILSFLEKDADFWETHKQVVIKHVDEKLRRNQRLHDLFKAQIENL